MYKLQVSAFESANVLTKIVLLIVKLALFGHSDRSEQIFVVEFGDRDHVKF